MWNRKATEYFKYLFGKEIDCTIKDMVKTAYPECVEDYSSDKLHGYIIFSLYGAAKLYDYVSMDMLNFNESPITFNYSYVAQLIKIKNEIKLYRELLI